MPKATFKNTSTGARGVWGVNPEHGGHELHMLEVGKQKTLEVSDVELEDQQANGYFAITEADDQGEAEAPAEPGPLDGSVPDLEAHIATVEDPDAIQALLDAEAAGKSRKGALAALEARRDELLGA